MYGHVITKFSWMGRLLHFLTHGALLVRFARESSAKNSDHSDARTTKPAMRKECDHVSSPFWFDKQSHVTPVVNVWHQNQPSHLSLHSKSIRFVIILGNGDYKNLGFSIYTIFGVSENICPRSLHELWSMLLSLVV